MTCLLATKTRFTEPLLSPVVWRNPFMGTEDKVRIYKACVRPIMTYGIDTRADTKAAKSKLRVAEMRTLRRTVRKTVQ